MQDFLSFISDVLWGSVMIYLLAGAGLWFSWRTGFLPFRCLLDFRKSFSRRGTEHSRGLSAFQTLCLSLAARVGSGNIAGVAIAITVGGPGAVFWMWVTALLGMALSFAECSLAQLYKVRDEHGQFRGGPAWYMEHGLGMRWMGVIFSVFLLLAFGLVFNAVQANALTLALNYAFALPKIAIAFGVALLTLLTIMRGMKSVARLSMWLVPLMSLCWIGIALTSVAMNLDALPALLTLIFKSAFGLQEVSSGVLGYTLGQAITIGFQRGMFSNEAGLGSSPNAAAAADSNPAHPAAQGVVQMFGVLFDTLVICSSTAFIIMLSGVAAGHSGQISGVLLAQQALENLFGQNGPALVALVVMLFAFSSIVANYIYAENNLVFLRLKTPGMTWLLRAGTLCMVLFGAMVSQPLVWRMADVVMALMGIINLTALLLLSPVVATLAKDYLRQRRLGSRPTFDPRRFPEIDSQISRESWPGATENRD